jgi:hypothetical protein
MPNENELTQAPEVLAPEKTAPPEDAFAHLSYIKRKKTKLKQANLNARRREQELQEEQAWRAAAAEVRKVHEEKNQTINAGVGNVDSPDELQKRRDVLDAHYDYLFRKYGTGAESLDIGAATEHLTEIMRDVANSHTDLELAENTDGFLNMENPKDVRLLNRIRYYSCLTAYMAVVNAYSSEAGRHQSYRELMVPVDAMFSGIGAASVGHIGEHPGAAVDWNASCDQQ